MAKQFELELGGVVYRPAFDVNAMIAFRKTMNEDPQDVLRRVKDMSRFEQIEALRGILWASLITDCGLRNLAHPPLMQVGLWIQNDHERIGGAIEKIMGSGGTEFPGQLAPFVPTPEPVVAKMIQAAEIKPGMHVVDLGAGDGRVLFAAVDAGATATGYELHPERGAKLVETVSARELLDKITIVPVDIRKAAIGQADVVFMYLLASSNAELKAKLLAEMKPGAVVVSHDFAMPDWEPETVETVMVANTRHTVYSWRIPG